MCILHIKWHSVLLVTKALKWAIALSTQGMHVLLCTTFTCESTIYIQTLSVLDTTFQCYCRPANMWCLWSVWLHTCMIHTGRQLPTYSHHLEWGSRWWTQLWQAWVAARMPKEQQVSMSCVWHHMSSALAFRLRRAEPANKFCAFMHGCMQLMVKAVC